MSRRPVALAGMAVVAAVVAVALWWVRPAAVGPALDGAALFAAKGCATCHGTAERSAATGAGPPLGNAAVWAGRRHPELSAADYLRQSIDDPAAFVSPAWSSDPSVVSPMPALGLSPAERDAVVAFLLADDDATLATFPQG